MAASFQPPASWTAWVAAPRAVSSTASPTRPPCEFLRPSRPAAEQAAANRRFTWSTPRPTTAAPGSGVVAACRWRMAAAQPPTSVVVVRHQSHERVGQRQHDGGVELRSRAQVRLGRQAAVRLDQRLAHRHRDVHVLRAPHRAEPSCPAPRTVAVGRASSGASSWSSGPLS